MTHQDHARLAGAFARLWGNRDFVPPQPLNDILVAVDRHDDAWVERDVEPFITPEGRPSAFSRELVGTYAAFEEVDLEDYLGVRGKATETVARDNPYAAIIVSMHTVNLLTDQADLTTLTGAQRDLHTRFIEGQLARQAELRESLAGDEHPGAFVDRDSTQRAFEFLQACDSFSLLACVDFDEPATLRHSHPTREGERREIAVNRLTPGRFLLDPWPLHVDHVTLSVPCRKVAGTTFDSLEGFRSAYRAGEESRLAIELVGRAN